MVKKLIIISLLLLAAPAVCLAVTQPPAKYISVTPSGSITATDVQDALEQLDAGKQPAGPYLTTVTANSPLGGLGTGASPLTFTNPGYITLASLSASNPITYNNVTGAIGWTNSNNYITLSSLSAGTGISYNSGTGVITNSAPMSYPTTGLAVSNGSGWDTSIATNYYYPAANPNSYIPLTALSSSMSGLTYTNTTGVFSLTSGYYFPTTTDESAWNSKQAALTFANSVQNTTGTINLVGDSTSPGNSYYYGTNSSGTKGFYTIPSGMVYPSSAGIAVMGASTWGSSISGTSSQFVKGNGSLDNTSYVSGTPWTSMGYLTAVTADSPLSGAGTAASHLTVDLSSKQAASSILSALAGLSWSSGTPFVKMTGASSFSLDTSTYITGNQSITLSGAVTGSGATSISTTLSDNTVSAGKMQGASSAKLANGSVGNLLKSLGDGTFGWDTNTYLTSLSGAFLLDQTSPQTVINGTPIFNVGLKSNSDIVFGNATTRNLYVAAQSSGNTAGAELVVAGGAGHGSSQGGELALTGGQSGSGTAGAELILQGGGVGQIDLIAGTNGLLNITGADNSGLIGSHNGGPIYLIGGNASGSGSGGAINLQSLAQGYTTYAILDTHLLASGSSRTYAFPDKSGTFAMTSDVSGAAGNTTDVQYNNSGAFAGNDNFTFTASGNILKIGATSTGEGSNTGEIRLANGTVPYYVGFKASDTTAANVTYTWPVNKPGAGLVGFWKSDENGITSWDTNTYLTSLSGALLATGTVTGATSQAQIFTAPTTGRASINLAPSSAVNPSTPNSGDMWWNGTNLYFYNGATNKDLLAGGTWGSITGTLSSQTDLQNALNLKWNNDGTSTATGNWDLGAYGITAQYITTPSLSAPAGSDLNVRVGTVTSSSKAKDLNIFGGVNFGSGDGGDTIFTGGYAIGSGNAGANTFQGGDCDTGQAGNITFHGGTAHGVGGVNGSVIITGKTDFSGITGGVDFGSNNLTTTGTITDLTHYFGSATGVSATAVNGLLTLQGLKSGGTNETFTIALDTTSDRIILNSTSSASFLFGTALYLDSGVKYFGDKNGKFAWYTATTGNDNLQFGLSCNASDGSGYMTIVENADMGNANRSPLATSVNPTLRIYSADATIATPYIEFYHNNTNGVIDTGLGGIDFLSTNLVTLGTLGAGATTLSTSLSLFPNDTISSGNGNHLKIYRNTTYLDIYLDQYGKAHISGPSGDGIFQWSGNGTGDSYLTNYALAGNSYIDSSCGLTTGQAVFDAYPDGAVTNWWRWGTGGSANAMNGKFFLYSGALGANVLEVTNTTGAFDFKSGNLTTTGTLGAGATTVTSLTDSGLTASKVVFTDASKVLTSTGIGTSSQFLKGDGSLDGTTYLSTLTGAVLTTGNQTVAGTKSSAGLSLNFDTGAITGTSVSASEGIFPLYDSGNTWTSQYPTLDTSHVLATSYFSTGYYPYFATDPSTSLTGNYYGNQWIATGGVVTNQRFQIDLGSAKTIVKIKYSNSHSSGGQINTGVKDFTFWGSNTSGAFADTTWISDAAMIAEGWTQLTTSQSYFEEHVPFDQADIRYITVTNSTPYQYYAFKFADNWGSVNYIAVRRIELQSLNGSLTPNLSVDQNGRKLYTVDGTLMMDYSNAGTVSFGNNTLMSPLIYGSNTANGNLVLQGTSNATNSSSSLLLQSTGGMVAIGRTTASFPFDLSVTSLSTQMTLGSTAGVIFGMAEGSAVSASYGLFMGLSANGSTWIQAGRVDSATAYNLSLQGSGGNVGIGLATNEAIDARLKLAAGTATANTQPLKLTSGVDATTAETGAFSYDGTHLKFTPTGTLLERIPTGWNAGLTLTAGTSTVVTDSRCKTTSTIFLQPTSLAFTALSPYISAKANGSFTITTGVAVGNETADYLIVN